MNTKENQDLRTLDVVAMLVGLVAIGVITQKVILGDIDPQKKSMAARLEMEQISQSLVVTQPGQDHSGRSIASVEDKGNPFEGTTGKDPWGHAYHFAYLKNAYGQPTHLVLLSKGPNGEQDTSDAVLQKVLESSDVKAEGDDIITFRTLR